ncbi:TlyA family RNA methyltransferase [Leucobacter sp. UT-8R-CII-1-4]|uniref:TlyA family RNA methyltransferase n=1 Tax=Leucobacter sp. UT-8R-CII-1-4 TaxID=3040075 RepID=UPI0024A9F7BC|nr:TlyA family RNA methyltransferase [Leucobacter sp. UT-8R-CII-1-4]MDI6023351.1 TlyA family RNA methyltransferase [Leucobacter sp. UT-8R-CII-1-4]
MNSAIWLGDAERLDRVLPSLDLARSRSQAAELIAQGKARVDGNVVTKAGAKVGAGAEIAVEGGDHYVSRAAHKLLAGLDLFQVEAKNLLALDVGASTGGFTQVLLERGAREVLSVDVGHDQLAPSIRADDRVRVVEGFNAREMTAESLSAATGVSEAPELIVADLSFISLELVIPAMLSVSAHNAEFILLIKPQFEVGRLGVSGGIVTNTELAADAVERVIRFAETMGLTCGGIAASPITGEHGNQEVLAHFTRTAPTDPTEWKQHIRALFIAGGSA